MKNKFLEPGMYNATGFILNMTKGVVNFEVTANGVQIGSINETNEEDVIEPVEEFIEKSGNENILVELPNKETITNFRNCRFCGS